MENKHTLSPWEVSKKFPTHVYKWIDGNTFRIVATCDSHEKDEQAQADARLIAAAPDLLEALEPFSELVGRSPLQLNEMMRKAKAAIAKARG